MALLDEQEDGYFIYWCQGCNKHHGVWTSNNSNPRWDWNGSLEKPTFSPSLLHRGVTYEKNERGIPDLKTMKEMVCHVFITDGKIQYLNDCTHELAGRTVEMQHLKGVL